MSYANLKLGIKMPLSIVACVILTAIILGSSSYMLISSALKEQVTDRLSAIATSRAIALEAEISAIQSVVRVQANSRFVKSGLISFTEAWQALSYNKNPKDYLQKAYITDNPHPIGEKENLDAASDFNQYNRIHHDYHPFFRMLLRENGFYDIFLFDTQGNLIYSVFKELDFATNMVDGEWKNTDLAAAYQAAATGESNQIHFFDFQPYLPSNNAPASFMSAPVTNTNGERLGVIAFQMPIGAFNRIMQERTGLGETGESYIVGEDRLMRSDSRFAKESTILKQSIPQKTVDLAISGKTGVEVVNDYRNVPVLSAYTSMDVLGTKWVILAEIDEAEAFSSVRDLSLLLSVISIGIALFGGGVGFFLSKGISLPIVSSIKTMQILASGNLNIDIHASQRKDEVGQLQLSLVRFKQKLLENDQLEQQQKSAEELTRAEKSQLISNLATSLSTGVGERVEQIAEESDAMEQVSHDLASHASEGANNCEQVSTMTTTVSSQASAVAAASNEMFSSIAELQRQVSLSVDHIQDVATKAKDANGTIQDLSAAANQISDVITIISDIAAQTNLLALNATIEAARAGDAGKGFAVVAGEVKNLSTQTANATEQISRQINDILRKTNDAVKAINTISTTVNTTSDLFVAIDESMEQQTAAVGEIVERIQNVSDQTQNAERSVDALTLSIQNISSSSKSVSVSAANLNAVRSTLKTEMDRFIFQLESSSDQDNTLTIDVDNKPAPQLLIAE